VLQGSSDLREFGQLLDEGWRAKRSLSERVSTPEIDDLYATAQQAGAVGGKLTGAGGGGFLLLFVPPDRQVAVRSALGRLVHVPFGFEYSGSQIIFYSPEERSEPLSGASASAGVMTTHVA
jgi:D-glycero-alpha-D-manno-heptose-7-phosphate kinase